MSKYAAQDIIGSKFQRARYVQIENVLGAVARCWFLEEEVINLGDEKIKRDVDSIELKFDPEEVFELVDPVTGEPLGKTATHRDVYIMLHSLYIQQAQKRDEQAIADAMREQERQELPELLPKKAE